MILPAEVARTVSPAREAIGRAEQLEGWLTANVTALGLLLAVVFLGGSAGIAARRPLWYDEIFSREISRLSPGGIWRALLNSADNQPYPFYLITHYSQRLFGNTNYAVRFPQTLGFLCMGICIYFFMRRRARPLCALATALLPLASDETGVYAAEGRPYGFMLGCCGLILVCWQAAAEGSNRRWAIPGLALSVAAAVSSHYLCILILVPIGLAELVRIRKNRRLDLPVLCALAAGLAPLAIFLPLIRAMRVYKDGFWATGSISSTAHAFELSTNLAWIGVAMLCIAALAGFRTRNNSAQPSRFEFPLHEKVAVTGLFLLPLIALAAAKFTGALHFRYVLGTVVGASILCGTGIDRLVRRTPALGLIFLFCTAGILVLRSASDSMWWRANPRPPLLDVFQIAEGSPLPIVADDSPMFLEEYEKGDASFNSRFWYVADPAEAKVLGFPTTSDLGAIGISRILKMNVASLDQFLPSHPSFTLVVVPWDRNWLLQYLLNSGANVRFEAVSQGRNLFRVDLKQ